MPSIDTLCAREVPDPKTTSPHILPAYLTSSFDLETIDRGMRIFAGEENGHVYSRFGNPTVEAVASKIAMLEAHGLDFDAAGMLFSSGMSALHTLIMSTLKSGDTILTQGNLYGGSTELLRDICARSGIRAVFMDLADYEAVESALSEDKTIRMLFFETPANPTLQCLDMERLCGLAHRFNRLAVVDNTFATPILQQPFRAGADFVLHSTTKYLNGHGNAVAGAVVGRDIGFVQSQLWRTMKLTGTQPGILDAWLTYQGMKTLALRMEKHCANALALADYLEQHSGVSVVNYPGLPSHRDHDLACRQMKGFGGIVSFEIDGGLKAGVEFMRRLKHFAFAPTLGDVDTLILHPASMSHVNIPRAMREANGITDGLIRVSVGIESDADIIEGIDRALG